MSSNSVASSVGIPDQTISPRATSTRSLQLFVLSSIRHLRMGGYSLAVVSVVLAFLLRLLVDPWLGDQSPYLLFVVAVAVTGLYAGVRPALVAAGLGTVVAYFSFVPPRYQWGFAGPSDAVGFSVYLLGVASVILLTHARMRATEKAEQHRVQAEEILLKTERLSAAGRMASLLAHEINNPLAALTNVMFLLNQQSLSSPSRELLSAGTEVLHRINRIAAMTIGFFFDKDAPEAVRIRDVVDDVAETLTSAERFRNIQCSREFRTDPNIVASPPRIKQLIASLLTNAMESGARRVCVRVNVAADWRWPRRNGVRITIADDGCGISHERREEIFEPFVSSKSQKGTGLGLWASRAIALRNDGKIKMRSAVAGPRKGTCVSVFLPTTAAETRVLPLDIRRVARTTK
jgi:signal transduction histidine kinase